jgi:hypothetical protein
LFVPNRCDYVDAGAHVVTGDEQQVGESLASKLLDWVDLRQSAPAKSSENDTAEPLVVGQTKAIKKS